MKQSAMPARVVPLLRSSSLERTGGLQRTRIKPAGNVVTLKPWPQQVTRSTIPPGVLALVDKRDDHYCTFCGRWQKVIDHHHRRLKQMDGSVAPHTECACNIVSACGFLTDSGCHRLVHLERLLVGEPRGFIVPQETPFPSLVAVTLRSPESGELRPMYPTCDGHWSPDEPEGAAA